MNDQQVQQQHGYSFTIAYSDVSFAEKTAAEVESTKSLTKLAEQALSIWERQVDRLTNPPSTLSTPNVDQNVMRMAMGLMDKMDDVMKRLGDIEKQLPKSS
jgi:hypothetical protein